MEGLRMLGFALGSRTIDVRRGSAVCVAMAILIYIAPFNVGPAHAAVAGTASVTNPSATIFRGSSGNTFAFTTTNTSTGNERVAAVFVTGPSTGNPWTVTACSAPANWSSFLIASPNGCYFSTTGNHRLDLGQSVSGLGVTATAASGSTDVTGAWAVYVSPSTDGTGFVQASAASSGALNSTIKVLEVLSAVVADASATIDGPCPASSTSAPEDSFKVIVVCGKNHGDTALTPTAGSSSLSGTFIQTPGTFASGAITADTSSSRVLANYSSTRIATAAGSGKTVIVAIGNTGAVSPTATFSGYTATADTVAPDTTIVSGTPGGATITASATATYSFTATEPGSTFECSMSTGADSYTACTSPKGYGSLSPGSYTFKVRATDPAGNTDASAASRALTVISDDTQAPSVTSVTATSPTAASSIDYVVTLSEDVTTVVAGDFKVTTTGVSGASVSSVSGSGATRTVTVSTGSGSGTIRLDVDDADGTIQDGAGNSLQPPGFTSGTVVTIDKTAPSVTSVARKSGLDDPTNAATVTYTVTFSEAVTPVATGDFTITATGTAAGTVSSVTGSGATLEVTVASVTGTGSLRLDVADGDGSIKDGVGNALAPSTFTTGETFTIDNAAPSVSSISAASPTNASSIAFTVTFSEPVTPVDASDFGLTTSGVSGASITSVAGTGATRTVTVATGSGSGTIRLDVDDSNLTIEDSVGNALNPATFTSGTTVTVDRLAPSVSSVVRADTNPTSAPSVDFTVTFSEPVSSVDASDFSLTTSGILGAAITGVTGSGATRTVTVSTGSGSGTIRLDVNDADGSVADPATNILAPATFTTGESYTMDRSLPSVSSIERVGSTPTNDASIDFTVTFSESVSPVVVDDFTLTTSGVSGASITGVTGSDATRTVSVSTGTGSGTIRLDLDDDDSTIMDATANTLAPPTFTSGESYTLDRSAPSVSSISAASPTNASSVDFTVTFSEAVASVVSSDFELTASGVSGASVSGVSGSGATRTVSVSTGTGSGTIRLDLDDSDNSIQDIAGNALDPDTFTSGTVVTVDKSDPSVSSITRKSGEANPTNASTVIYTVTFSEPVAPVATSDFVLTATGTAGGTVAAVSGSGTTYDVTVSSVTGTGTLRLDLTDPNTSIRDTSNNALVPTTFTTGETFTIDSNSPSMSSIAASSPTNAASIDYTVTFSEAVSPVVIQDFALSTSGVSGASITTVVSGSGTTWVVTVSTGTGSGTIRLDLDDANSTITDAAGNALSATTFTSGTTVTVDKAAPSVSSIVRASSSPTNASSVAFTVTFSEPVAPVATSDFTATATGSVTGPAVSAVTGSGTTWTVTVSSGSGSGTIRLDLTDADATIEDEAGNAVGPTTFTSGETFTVDRNAPNVSSITRAAGEANPTNASSVIYTVAFSEAVGPVATGDFSLTSSGTSAGTISVVSGTGATRSVTVSSVVGTGSLRLDLADGNGSVTDEVGNALSPSTFTTGEAFTIDNTPPALSLVSPGDGSTITDQRPTFTGIAAVGDPATITIDLYIGSSIPTDGTLPERTLTATRDAVTGEYSVKATGGPQLADNTTYTAQAYQTDDLGNQGASNASTFTIDTSFTDTAGPIVIYTFPGAGGTYNASSFAAGCGTVGGDICGSASDSTGIGGVEISILRSADGTYWNGSTFSGTTPIFNPATGTSSWSYPIAGLADGSYTVAVRATDSASAQNVSTSALSFTIDTVAPSVTLSAPGHGSTTTDTTPTFLGLASIADPAPVTVKVYAGTSIPTDGTVPLQMLIASRDAATGSFAVDAAVLPDTATYTAQAYQTDDAGNVGASSPTTFTIESPPPTGGGGGGGLPDPTVSPAPTISSSPSGSPSPTPDASPSPEPSTTPPDGKPPRASVEVNTRHMSPNGDGDLDSFRASIDFSEPVFWVFTITSPTRKVFEAFGSADTRARVVWDGSLPNGRPVRDRSFRWKLVGVDAAGSPLELVRGRIHVDIVAPVIRDLNFLPRAYPWDTPVFLTLSVFERAHLRVVVDEIGSSRRVFEFTDRVRPGEIALRWDGTDPKGRHLQPGGYVITIRLVDRAHNRRFKQLRFDII